MTLRPSSVTPTVDVTRDGEQHGHLRLPYSRDDSAWGSVMIPITVVKRGDGPTALLTGANHGDEYEGPVALFDLARKLKAEDVTGRVIIVPAMNHPAFLAGTRTSPIDKGNLNRAFPGRPDGTVTEKIADYFTRHLVPLADLVLDFHSGGRTLDFVPFAAAHVLDDEEQRGRCMQAAWAFGAPYTMRMTEIDAVGMYDTTVEGLGKTFVTTELRGGGTASAETVQMAKHGLRNLLRHAGIIEGRAKYGRTVWLETPSAECFVFAAEEGLVEPMRDLGHGIGKGDVIARIHPVTHTGRAPYEHRAAADGIVAARHFPGLVKVGDCLAVVATVEG